MRLHPAKQLSLLVGLFIILGGVNLQAQEKLPGLDASPMDMSYLRVDRNAPPIARVIYGRPQKKGRDVMGGLIPYDKVWRTGANEATEITFYKDVTFGGEKVGMGSYSLFTIPGEKEWTVILNSKLHQWGSYQYSEGDDIVRIRVPVSTIDTMVEAFTIVFQNQGEANYLVIIWDRTKVMVPVGI